MLAVREKRSPRQRFTDTVIVGKDLLDLLSSATYVDPLTIYREFIQNAADSIDEAGDDGLYSGKTQPRIDITFDFETRTACIRDNGVGIPRNCVLRRLTSLGASKKRGTAARGFRGVGRLAGLAYCQEMVFRTKSLADDRVYEMYWDCRRLKELLRNVEPDADLASILHEIISVDSASSENCPAHFFEVELRQVIRHRNDLLLNEDAINRYLSQVGPVPFPPGFAFGNKIQQFLEEFNAGKVYSIYVKDSKAYLVRPFLTDFEAKKGVKSAATAVETFQVPGITEGVDAVGWILHHDYLGAIPDHLGVKGLRARVGNIQIGDANTFQGVFPEPRFNSWAIGEVHVLTPRIVPNGRRDDFQQNSHYANLINHLVPKGKIIARKCRECSAIRARSEREGASAGLADSGFNLAKVRTFLGKHGKQKLSPDHRKRLRNILAQRGVTYEMLFSFLSNSAGDKNSAK